MTETTTEFVRRPPPTIDDLRLCPPSGAKPRAGAAWPTHRARARHRRRVRQAAGDREGDQ